MEVKFAKFSTGRVELSIIGGMDEYKNPGLLAAANRAVSAKIGQLNSGNIAELFKDVEVEVETLDEVSRISAAMERGADEAEMIDDVRRDR